MLLTELMENLPDGFLLQVASDWYYLQKEIKTKKEALAVLPSIVKAENKNCAYNNFTMYCSQQFIDNLIDAIENINFTWVKEHKPIYDLLQESYNEFDPKLNPDDGVWDVKKALDIYARDQNTDIPVNACYKWLARAGCSFRM